MLLSFVASLLSPPLPFGSGTLVGLSGVFSERVTKDEVKLKTGGAGVGGGQCGVAARDYKKLLHVLYYALHYFASNNSWSSLWSIVNNLMRSL